jgi:hypothetical protein
MAIAAAFALFTANTFAQAKPDFAGKWTREAPAGGGAAAGGGGGGGGRAGGGGGGRGGAGGGGGFNCGMSCTITVSGNNLTIERMQGDQTVKTTLDLNGTATNKVTGRGGEAMEIKTVGKWDGNKLVFTTVRDFNGQSITSTQTVSIEGGKLTVVSNSGMPDAQPTTATYTKG